MSKSSMGWGRRLFAGWIASAALLAAAPSAWAALTVTPLTWNIVGLDSNTPATGPEYFPVGARVCSTTATTNVAVDYVWDTANPFVNLRPGSLSSILFPAIGAGACVDAYFEVAVTRTAAAFDTTRGYHITATDGSGTASTPVPRELYVEHLVSQARNSVTNISFGPAGGPLVSVAPGGAMNLVVGNQYDIRLEGGTATGGYEQFAAFINFSNAIFRIVDVDTTYAVVAPPRVVSPNDRLYADACLWENNPSSPNYRACLSTGKAGGAPISTTYRILIVSGGGSSETLNTLLYDFSGSSFHYNADYGVGARIANIIDPASAGIAKAFIPSTTSVGGVSKLQITLTNPNAGALTGFAFTDALPAGMSFASPTALSTTGCGTPTFTPAIAPGGTSIGFSNGSVAANSSCVIAVNVVTNAVGASSFVNTTGNLFVGAVDTGKTATATLTVSNAPPPPPPLCGLPMATWNFLTGSSATNPAPTSATVAASANAGTGLTPSIQTDNVAGASGSWASDNINTGALNTVNNEYFEFVLNTTGFTSVDVSFQGKRTAQGPTTAQLFSGLTGSTAGPSFTLTTAFQAFGPTTINSGLNPAGNTLFRIYLSNASQNNNGHFGFLDGVTFTGCAQPQQPTLTKAFAPTTTGVGPAGVSTLTFTLTNPNAAALTGAGFTDALPAGLQVAGAPAAATTCGGTWAPVAGSTNLVFSGGTIPASSSCTLQVAVTATSPGPKANTSGSISTTQTGTNIGPTGSASATLTAIAAPSIDKTFGPNPILAGGISTLTFVITNPNPDHAIGSVAFTDTFPVAPGAMVVAATPNGTTAGCGLPTFSPAAGAGSIAFSGGSIAAGGTCTVRVDVSAPVAGSYANTSGAVSHVVGATTFNGNTTSDTLVVNPPNPSVTLLKQVGATATGPWLSYLAVTTGANVFYRITIENTGDVPLNPVAVSDPAFANLNTLCSFPASLPVAVAANDNHIATCIFDTGTPIAAAVGEHPNTATANATGAGVPVSDSDTATYATTGLTLAKSANPTTYTAAGEPITYSFLVTNSGFATLSGPVTITDPLVTATCPALTTVGDLDAFFDPGESITCTAPYTTTAADVTNGSITNVATASAGGATSPSSTATITTPQSADLSVVKTLVTAGPYAPGGSVVFNVTVSNAGPNAASNLSLTDSDINLTVTNVSSVDMTCAGSVFPCTRASLASGASATVTVTATIDAVGAFSNSATIGSGTPDPVPGNNTGTDGNIATSADLTVVKTLDTAGPFAAGGTVNFTVTVTNNGPSAATNVSVSDVDTNLTVVSAVGSGLTCAGSVFPCTVPSLASGASATIAVTATIDANGAFSNSATASSTTPDPVPGNNTGTAGNGATSADLSVVKTLVTAGPYAPGDTVTFSIVVTNNGPDTANNLTLTDSDTNLTVVSATSGSMTCAGNAFPCTLATLASAASVTVTVTATIDAVGAFDNSATIASATPDPVPGNNTGTDGDSAVSADLSVSKTLVTAGPYAPGGSVTFSIVVTNNGPSAAANVVVTDSDINLTPTNVASGDMTCVGNAFPCTLASLASGATATVTVTATIDAVGAFSNTASVASDTSDPVPGNNTDSDGDNATSADLAVVKTLDTAGPFAAGGTVNFTVTVTNNGPSAATNVSVSDVDTNLTVVSAVGSGLTCAGSVFPCTVPSLASGASATIAVTATIDANGAFSNSATASSDTPDPAPGNNTGTDGNGATSADLAVVKTLLTAGPYAPGGTVTFSIVVSNNGPDAASSVVLNDSDSNLTVVNVASADMVCAGSAFPCTLASLASGASATVTVTATIDAVGAFSNSATASSATSDPVPGNNTGSDGDSATSADLAVVKTLDTAGPYAAGGTVNFTVTVTNNGPSTATNVSVADIDTNLTLVSAVGTGLTCAGNAFPCTAASLASGASATIAVSATIDANGAFSNSATASSDTPDPAPGNNTGTDGNGATSADLAVVKTLLTAGPYAPGGTVTFSIVVTNNGPDAASNVVLNDSDANLTVVSATSADMTCAGNVFPCTLASLASGATATVTATATIDATGAFSNTATATSTTPDPTPGNNGGSDGDTAASADLGVVKTLVSAGPFVPGDSVVFAVVVTNNGPSAAANVVLADSDTNLTPTNVASADMTCAGNAFPCTLASLASGASATVTVTATIDAVGVFSNTATAASDTPDPVPGNNTGTDGDSAALSADVSVVKTLDTAGPFTIGQSVSYTLLVANAGPSTATNVFVTDAPANLTITTVSGGGCASLPCTIPSLASGASVSITLGATIDATGAFDNVATVDATEPDPDPANNIDDAGNGGNAGAQADLSLAKSVDVAAPTVGDNVVFTVTLSNAGPSAATGVQVGDLLPAGYSFVSANASQGSYVAASGIWSVGNVASAGSATLQITASVNPSGPYANVAQVTAANEPDPDSTPNNGQPAEDDQASASTVPVASADVSVVKTLTTAGPYSVGQSVSFDIVVANAGPSAASNVQVTDTPNNITLGAVSGGGCAALPCTLPSLASGASVTITVTGTIVADGAFGNTAAASSPTDDPDPTDNTDTDTGNTTATADLSIIKTVDNPIPVIGGTVTFSLAIANAGPSTALAVQVADVLPAGYTFVSATPSIGTYAGGVWTVGTLANGATATMLLQATVNATGPYANTGVVSSTTPDPDPSDNSSTATPTPVQGGPGSADLALVKTASSLAPALGSNVTFTLALQNTGPDDATAVQVSDLLPAGYTFVSATPSVGNYDAGTGVWSVGTLANGAGATLQITATVRPSGPYANTATASSQTPDPDPTDNISTATPVPVVNADLAVVKTGPAQITRGEQLVFNIQVMNRGPDAAINARLLDPTPAGLVFISTAGACTAGFPCTLGNMANGEVRNLTATYFVPADYAGPNMIVNTVTAVSDSADPTPGDSSSSSSVLVPAGVPNMANPRIVPVDARWAMMLLAMLLAMVAAMRIERR